MVHERILQFEQDADGVFTYVPDPDESEIDRNKLFLYELELGIRAKRDLVLAQELSLSHLLSLLPEWLKDAIYSISLLAQLLTSRFMQNGKWVKFSKWKLGWNFMSLIMLYRVAKDIVKAFKNPSQ